jgi:allantoicase
MDEMTPWNLVIGSKIENVSNQRFARAENLISPYVPTFDPDLFGRQGKIMDSWETARHNIHGFDSLEIRLSKLSSIRFVKLSTEYHDGNQAEFVRLLGLKEGEKEWQEFLPKTQMLGHAELKIRLDTQSPRFEKIRVEMFPDGGLSRLGLYQELPEEKASSFLSLAEAKCVRLCHEIPKSKKPLTIPFPGQLRELGRNMDKTLDLASQAYGAKVLRVTNEHYGPGAQVISPFPPLHMFDGLESARSRKTGHFEEVDIQLASPAVIDRIVLDFRYFINNNPSGIEIFTKTQTGDWRLCVARSDVKPFAGNAKMFFIDSNEDVSHIRVRTYPDGGINRIHVYGR